MKKVVLGIIAIVVAGCVFYFLKSGKNEVVEQCILLCKKALEQGVNLSNGPCLSDENPEWKFEKWVCDVAHWPRQSVDNLRENQCNEWWEAKHAGREIHFIEVTPSCKFIRAV